MNLNFTQAEAPDPGPFINQRPEVAPLAKLYAMQVGNIARRVSVLDNRTVTACVLDDAKRAIAEMRAKLDELEAVL